jgi:hypothetical protein
MLSLRGDFRQKSPGAGRHNAREARLQALTVRDIFMITGRQIYDAEPRERRAGAQFTVPPGGVGQRRQARQKFTGSLERGADIICLS